MADEWRQCVDWLVRCQIVSREHRVTSETARYQDLANLLKDGVLICDLLNCLNPGTLEPKDFSQRPQMSQFLCKKNINVFLQKCSSVFKMKNEDLFALDDLANLENFRKVLQTLAVLSRTPLAQKSKIEPLSLTGRSTSFTGLSADSNGLEDDDDEDDHYVRANDLCEDEIYGCLVDYAVTPTSQDLKTKTKRDFCIEELVETEKNYLEALEMINAKFMKPLKECQDILSSEDWEKIFMGNGKLLSIHREFLEKLKKASSHLADGSTLTIPDCFMTFKEKFLYYGEFCSNLTRSQELLAKLCQNNMLLQKKIMECQKAANEGKFKLHDLLAIPMQRVLKYHLLLNELIKNTDEHHAERKSLERALDEMQDLSLFVNEVRRDHEMLNGIGLLEKSIVELPVNIVLRDCGRILMDGEMKVKLVSESVAHSRHLFLFDKRLLICKPSKNDVYTYKTSLLLSTYKLDETLKDKASFQLQEISGNTYHITAKNPEVRNKWRNGILLAQDNICPQHAHNKKHDFQMETFKRLTICDVCRKFLRGSFFQGYRCQNTEIVAHKECLEKALEMEGPPTPLPPRSKEKVVAINSYDGFPNPPSGQTALKFNIGDVIDIIGSCSNPSWALGEFNGRRGEFPRSHVKWPMSRTASNVRSNDESYINLISDKDISSQPWYAGELSREKANELLEKRPKGAFLVRKCADGKKEHAISIQCGTVKHLKIGKNCKDGEDLYFLVSSKSFHSITDLVSWYSENSLEKFFPEVKTPLTTPCGNVKNIQPKSSASDKGKGFCIAKYDYAATAPNQLSVKRGDRIEVLSKAGEDRGWWKGSLNGKTGFFPKSYVKECES